MKVQDKCVVITGAGSGMGRELTLQLLAKGARVAAIDVNEASLKETTERSGVNQSRLSVHCIDISKLENIQGLAEKIAAIHGSVDILINNAGIIQPFIRVNDLNLQVVNRVMAVNFFGPLYLIKEFLPHLILRKEAFILNISSMGGFLPVPGQSVYGASKAALKLLTEGLTSELSETGVRVAVVFPGAVSTNITQNSGVESPASSSNGKKFKAMPADRAASLIIQGIEKNKQRIFVGNDSKMMNLLYRISPSYAMRLINKQMKSLLK